MIVENTFSEVRIALPILITTVGNTILANTELPIEFFGFDAKNQVYICDKVIRAVISQERGFLKKLKRNFATKAYSFEKLHIPIALTIYQKEILQIDVKIEQTKEMKRLSKKDRACVNASIVKLFKETGIAIVKREMSLAS